MIVIIDKESLTCILAVDQTTAGNIIGVHRMTIKRHLPYWETNKYIICHVTEIIKSDRGRKDMPILQQST